MTGRLYLVDASSYIYRAFHSIRMMHTPAPGNTPCNAVYGFCEMMLRRARAAVRESGGMALIGVICDAAPGQRDNFRTAIYPAYKGNRKPPDPGLVPQFAGVRQAAEAMGLKVMIAAGAEADDLLATYAADASAQGIDVTILSSDKDLMQCVRARNEGGPGSGEVSIFDPMRKPGQQLIGPAEVEAKFGVRPGLVPDVQAIWGDTTDDIPGVAGIGQVNAAKIILKAGSLQAALAAPRASAPSEKMAEALRRDKAKAEISYRLALLRTDMPMPIPIPDMIFEGIDVRRFTAFLERFRWRSILEDLGGRP